MRTILLSLFFATWCLAGEAGEFVLSGEIHEIDGDGSGDVDLEIERITFSLTAGTTVAFDVLAREIRDNNLESDLNGDGECRAFDAYLTLFSGETKLAQIDDYPHGNPLNQDGFVHDSEPTFEPFFLNGADYTVTLGANGYTPAEALQGHGPSREFYNYADPFNGPKRGDWQLTMRWIS